MENPTLSYDDAVDATREAVLASVKLRLRADVPLAFCMSGGIDSNALIATAKRKLNYDVHGFTIVNSDARYEEQDMVQASVQGLSDHTARHVAGFLIAVYDGLQVQWLIDSQRAPTPDQLMAALETVLPAALATAPVGGSSRTTNPPAACS